MHRCNVLIIQNDDRAREAIAALLRLESFGVNGGRNVDEALRAAASGKYCSVLFDVGYAGLHGAGILEELRNHPLTNNLGLVAMCATASHTPRGVKNVLVMPFAGRELLSAISSSCPHSRQSPKSA